MALKNLKLGTRRSLLALAQSGWVARQIERLNPGVQVELVGIDTRGDKILDVSLRNVAGKEFFVAELDDALRSGRVDFTVHSMKDLSLDRPEDFTLAAIPARANPRDVILFAPSVMEKLARGQALKIGTSSPRRLENIPAFLNRALPKLGGNQSSVELVEIRGNVNTRLSRVHEPAESPKQLDAVVLAFAGLSRLWQDGPGREELRKLLTGVRWMVLPLRECPAAPAQGALAVECRAADAETRAALARLHDADTAHHVSFERGLLAQFGGGCHQRFGATAISVGEDLRDLFYVRGKRPDGVDVDEFRWQGPSLSRQDGRSWDGSEQRSLTESWDQDFVWNSERIRERAVFIAHSRAARSVPAADFANTRVWTSGTASWEKLAAQGIWVDGCAEGLGFEFLRSTLSEGVLQLPDWKSWTVLTHSAALSDWEPGQAIATYEVSSTYSEESRAALRAARHVFWSSASQFDELKDCASKDAIHACGPGRTAAKLKERGMKPLVFPSVEEWRQWLKINNAASH